MTLDDQEIWAVIHDFPDYEVSNYGNVINIHTERYLKPREAGSGYQKVSLRRDNKTYERYVHILVAQAFFTGYREGIRVGRIEKDSRNNSIWNLQMRMGNARPPRLTGPRWGHKVRIVELDRTFLTVRDCARYIGGDYSSIYACLRGDRRRHMGYTFERVEE